MGHLGFSYTGLIFLLMLALPNLLWLRYRPGGYSAGGESKVLLVFERVGQASVSTTALIFRDFNLHPWSAWSLWLVAAAALMMIYEGWWIRYFRGRKTMADFYSSFCGAPLAGATLPVAAFFLLGIYGKVIWMVIAVAILGIGHIGIHLQHQQGWAKKL